MMKSIEKEFDEYDLIRMEEIEAVRGDRPLPSDKLLNYWRTALRSWLDEYLTADKPSAFKFAEFAEGCEIKPLEIRRNNILDDKSGAAFFAVLQKKRKDGKTRWMCCPISNFKTPATMWEFAVPLENGKLVIAESWNIFTVDEDEMKKATSVPSGESSENWHIKKDSADIILHAFQRQMESRFQDLPMTSVGPRIFRPNDPRIEYQRLEREKFSILSKLGNKSDDDEMKRMGVISAKEWLQNNKNNKHKKEKQ